MKSWDHDCRWPPLKVVGAEKLSVTFTFPWHSMTVHRAIIENGRLHVLRHPSDEAFNLFSDAFSLLVHRITFHPSCKRQRLAILFTAFWVYLLSKVMSVCSTRKGIQLPFANCLRDECKRRSNRKSVLQTLPTWLAPTVFRRSDCVLEAGVLCNVSRIFVQHNARRAMTARCSPMYNDVTKVRAGDLIKAAKRREIHYHQTRGLERELRYWYGTYADSMRSITHY